ncbi:MAG: DMT family transporter [Oscillospiraceae bacterium]|nr:DMT family transporter [Oscillospiraceae bacterium]
MDNTKTKKTRQIIILAAAMCSSVLWAANLPATRFILQFYSPYSLALFRFFVASVCLGIFAAAKKTPLPKKKDIPMLAVAGIIGVFLFTIFLNTGARTVYSGIASFIVNTSPVFVLIFARILLKETVKPACKIGILISFAGLVGMMVSQATEFSFNIGIFLLLLAAICYSLYTVISRGLLKTYTVFEVLTFSMILGTIGFVMFTPDLIRDFSGGFPWYTHLIVVIMGILPGALANLTWLYALSKAEKTAHVTVFLYLTPFLAALLGFLWLGETLSVWAFLGGAVIIGGMVITNTLGKR